MNISKMIEELCAERERIDEAIVTLQKLSLMGPPRRGRPPAWTRVTDLTAPQGRNGQNGSRNGQNGSMKGVAPPAAQD